MNAEYKNHKQVWQMVKPRMDAGLEASHLLAWARPLTLAAIPESLVRFLAIMDPATLTHGIRELASPLSD